MIIIGGYDNDNSEDEHTKLLLERTYGCNGWQYRRHKHT